MNRIKLLKLSQMMPTMEKAPPAPKVEAPKPEAPKAPEPIKENEVVKELTKNVKKLFGKVNDAIQQKIAEHYLSIGKQASLENKYVATKQLDGSIVIKNGSYDHVIENTVSIYEPVDFTTTYFSVKNIPSIKQSVLIANKIEKLGFKTEIVKQENSFSIKCNSDKEHNTTELFDKLGFLNIEELVVGRLKKHPCSLNDDGTKDITISIGE